MKQEKKQSTPKNYLGTTQKILVAITGVVVALGALISAFKNIDLPIVSPKKQADKYKFEIKSYNTIPYGLLHTINNHEFLYWSKFDINNNSKETLIIHINFELTSGPATVESTLSAAYTILPKTNFSKVVDPNLVFLNDSFDEPVNLRIIARVKNTEGKILHSDTKVIKVLPKNVLYWDLATPEKKQVEKAFLVASLTAWVKKPARSIKEYVKKLVADTDFSRIENNWLEMCYNSLKERIRISKGAVELTFSGNQAIYSPTAILEGKIATPLEAALLMAAHCKAFDSLQRAKSHTALFAIGTPSSDHKTIFLAWQSEGSEWSALDMGNLSEEGFATNSSAATARIKELLRTNPNIEEQLKARGVFIDEIKSIAGLDFQKAGDVFQINGLP